MINAASYSAGLKAGTAMTDDEVLRYANGIIAALNRPELRGIQCARTARQHLGDFMDLLADDGMVATVGHAGTAVIQAAH